ncbi:DUF397 domain-containing protein [Streptomyces griseocarneus]|nr:DUF397 domain-containing protein [Streptomyces griseocarneus]
MRNAQDRSHAIWKKSHYCEGDGGECLEWAPAHVPTDTVPIRDSKAPGRTPLRIPPETWSAFVTDVKDTAQRAG